MLKGIDISKYQSSNYKSLIDTYGTDFVICRAAWRFSVDAYCDLMYQYAKSKGKKLGVYFFPLTSDGEPEKHAEWAYKQVLGYIGEAIFVLDWEAYNGAEGNNNESKVDWALRWLKKFEELSGNKPLIYMNSNCEKTYNWSPVYANDNGLWIANYGKNNGVDNGRPATKYWPVAAIHQYTSYGNLDKDTFYGDKAAWDLYAKVKKAVADAPVQNPNTDSATIEALEREIEGLENEIKELKKLNQEKSDQFSVCSQNLTDIKSTYKRLKDLLEN